MSKTIDYQMTREHRDLVARLWNTDEATPGRPQIAAEEVDLARDYLALVLVDDRAEIVHIELLQELYRAPFRYPLSRWFWSGLPRPTWETTAGFRHNQLLPDDKALQLAQQGVQVLDADEVAALLLNAHALCDLADLISYLMPAEWLERIAQKGRELMERHGLEVPIPGIHEAPAA